jgi:hypothetical protein
MLLPVGALPDPSQPSVIPLGAAFGAFVGTALGKLRGESGDELRDSALEGAFRGTGLAILAYTLALLVGLA